MGRVKKNTDEIYEPKDNIVWIVSYIRDDYGEEQVVIPFDNYNGANKMYEYYIENGKYKNVVLDRCEVFNNFYTPEEVEKMKPEELENIEFMEE